MSYQEAKSKNFAKYCYDGKIDLVKKWINNPNVDINYNINAPLRNAVRMNEIEIVKLLIGHSKLNTLYGQTRHSELEGAMMGATGEYVSGKLNPFTAAIILKRFEILDIFIHESNHPFVINRTENLDVILEMNDEEVNEYFNKLDGFTDYVLGLGGDYIGIISKEAKEIFLF